MAGWRFAGSCIDGEHFVLGDLNVWQEEWRAVPANAARVRDPIYGQEHHMGVYEIGPVDRPVRFAAGEFSNMVWGFYAPE